MANDISLLLPGLKTSLAQAMYNEIISNTNNYYYFLGKPLEWTGGASEIEVPKNTLLSENETRREIVFVKKVTPSDISFTIPRYDWFSGQVYDQYDDKIGQSITYDVTATANTYNLSGTFDLNEFGQGWHVTGNGIPDHTYVDEATESQIKLTKLTTASVNNVTITKRSNYKETDSDDGAISLDTSRFYVVTDEFKVYKCLFNNNGSVSTVKPFSTTHELIQTADGYIWKYMYTIPNSLVNKFMSLYDMPVTNAVKSSYYSKGAITSATIENYGTNYQSGDTLVVIGDGSATDNAYDLVGVTIEDPGSGYSSTPTLTIDPPFDGIQFQINTNYLSGQYLYVDADSQDRYFYEVVSTGKSGSLKPTHTSTEPIINGTCTLKFVGVRVYATATATIPTIHSITFNGSSGSVVSTANDTITYTAHGFTTGERVKYSNGGGTSIAGLSTIQSYYIIAVNANTIKLTTSYINAINGTNVVDITSLGTGTSHTLITVANGTVTSASMRGIISSALIQNPGSGYDPLNPPQVIISGDGAGAAATAEVSYDGYVKNIKITNRGSGYTSAYAIVDNPVIHSITFNGSSGSVVSTANDTITYTAHGFTTGDRVKYDKTTGTSIGGLSTTISYYVIVVNANTIKLTTSYINAINGTNVVDITSLGTGTTHKISDDFSTATVMIDVFHGYGYSAPPKITATPPFVHDYDYANELVVSTNKIIKIDNRFYRVIAATSPYKLGTEVPGITSGTMTCGDCTLEYIGQTTLLSIFAGKTKAHLVPVVENGQIINVIVQDPGIGYTTADITTFGYGNGAIITPDLSLGNLDTRQANTELLAIPGTIDVIDVLHSGLNYTTATVTVTGDGSGCTAEAVITQGAITKINVTDPGTGYTFANVSITGNVGSTQAYAKAIISPHTGHGKNAINELFAKDVALATTIARDRNQGFIVDNDYRQLGLIKNPTIFNSSQRYTKLSGSACYAITGDFLYGSINNDMQIVNQDGKKFIVIAKPETEPVGDVQLLVQSIDNVEVNIDDVFTYDTNKTATISAVVQPTIDKYSGEMMFIDNRRAFQPTEEQTLSIKTVIRL